MLRLIVVTIALSLALMSTAHGQTIDQAKIYKVAVFLNQASSELDQSQTNLLQMIEGMQSPESDRTMMIYDSATRTQDGIGLLLIVAEIHSLMVDIKDEATVKSVLVLLAKNAISVTNTTIGVINRELAKIRSPAAIAEAQKARDQIYMIRDKIQQAFPGS